MRSNWTQVLFLLLVAVSLAGGAYALSPAVRGVVQTQGREWLGWTEDARRADPVGFTTHVERKLRAESSMLHKSRQELAENSHQLSSKIKEQSGLRDRARKMADEFRGAYQTARASGAFPVMIRNGSYSEEQVIAQVSMLLAESSGLDRSLARLQQIQDQANKRLQEIVVRQTATDSQIAAIGAQRELLRARELSSVGEELIAQVDELFDLNRRVLTENPVRSLAELLASEEAPAPSSQTQHAAAVQFLSETSVEVAKPAVGDEVRSVEGDAAVTTHNAPPVAKPARESTEATRVKMPTPVNGDEIEFSGDAVVGKTSVSQTQSGIGDSPSKK